MTEEMIPIGVDEPLPFECSPDVSCFNECCRDLNQFLTPYDILRLKNNLGIKSDEFLKKYTSRHNGPESGLPVVTFKPDPASGLACPFVRESGCSVYKDRPASCRMYPIARAVVRSRQTGELSEHFALIEEPHCCGFAHKNGYIHRNINQKNNQPESQYSHKGESKEIYQEEGEGGVQTHLKQTLTVREWLESQDVEVHNQMNDKMVEIISLKNRIIQGKLDGADGDRFYLACYDLDTFRVKIFRDGLLSRFSMPPHFLEEIATNDLLLLELGLAWIKNMLFGIEITIWN
ncbi:MAG: YkgJ family cysteine cluster protein [Desulfamplus sp.]|nr:YkgJ family cysteine cluster protein [Desulfamplus sp.]